MIKTLKADFYKLFKSKSCIALLIIISCICVGLRVFFITTSHGDGMQNMFLGELGFIVIVFMAILSCRDFSSGLFKSTKRATNGLNWVLSKVIVLLTFVAFYTFLHLLSSAVLEFAYNYEKVGWDFLLGYDVLDPYKNLTDDYISNEYRTLFLNELLLFVNSVGIGMGCLALGCWCRNLIVSLIVPLFYHFFGTYLYVLIAMIFNVELQDVVLFTVMTGPVMTSSYGQENLSKITLIVMLTHVVFIFLMFGLSWLAMRKREVR